VGGRGAGRAGARGARTRRAARPPPSLPQRELRAAEVALHARGGGGLEAALDGWDDADDGCGSSSDDGDRGDPPAVRPAPPARPPPCAWLTPGAVFVGHQRVRVAQPPPRPPGAFRVGHPPPPPPPLAHEPWAVEVVIEAADHASGTFSGTMTATGVPRGARGARGAVRTAWAGHVVDGVNHTLNSPCWGTTAREDARLWGALDAGAGRAAARGGSLDASLAASGRLFLRWKETGFLGPSGALDSGHEAGVGLSISGFYALALDRATGALVGHYVHDPRSSPFQTLELAPKVGGAGGGVSWPEHGFR